MGVLRIAWSLLRETIAEWNEDKAGRLGAALAYYATLSLAPLLVVLIAVLSVVLGQAEAQQRVLSELAGVVDPQTLQAIARLVENMRPGAGLIATAAGVLTLFVTTSGLFTQLQDALNTIWEVQPRPGRGLFQVVRERLWSFVMVLLAAVLLMASITFSAGLALVGRLVEGAVPDLNLPLYRFAELALSLAITTVLFAVIYKILPDARNAWRDVWIGAGVTAVLFTLGKQALAFYIGVAAPASAYGAAGVVVIVLLWTYYSAQILLFGAEFTQVYARRFGSAWGPAANAVPVTELARAQQGMPHQAALLQATPPPFRPLRPKRPRGPRLVRRIRRWAPRVAPAALIGFGAGLVAGLIAWSRAAPRR